MIEMIEIIIDGQAVSAAPGTTILQAAAQLGIHIPTICFHEACTAYALCRLCVVEVQGARTLVPACVAQVYPDMQVTTRSERVERTRRTILEMLSATVDLSDAPEIQAHLQEYGGDAARFLENEARHPDVIDDNPFFVRDYAKCVLCWRCVQVCAEDAQYAFAINFSGRGYQTQISTFFEKPLAETSCVFCGQCVGVCPTGALKPKRQWLLEQGVSASEIRALTRFERRRRRKE